MQYVLAQNSTDSYVVNTSYLSVNINAVTFAKVCHHSKSNSSYLYVDFGHVNLGFSKANFVNISNLLIIRMILLTKCSHSIGICCFMLVARTVVC